MEKRNENKIGARRAIPFVIECRGPKRRQFLKQSVLKCPKACGSSRATRTMQAKEMSDAEN
jgi:hypothetical protein